MNVTKLTVWGLPWGWMWCASYSLYARSFSLWNLQLTANFPKRIFRVAVKCYSYVLSVVLRCAWPAWWMSIQETASFLELPIAPTNAVTRWSIFSLNSHHRFRFCAPQHTLRLFLRRRFDRFDWPTPSSIQSNMSRCSAAISLEFMSQKLGQILC